MNDSTDGPHVIVSPAVYFLVGHHYARAYHSRAFVHPSLSEGFSHVRLEAMATGIVDGAHDFTRDGTDGFVVPRRDPDALAKAALELLTDEERAGVGPERVGEGRARPRLRRCRGTISRNLPRTGGRDGLSRWWERESKPFLL